MVQDEREEDSVPHGGPGARAPLRAAIPPAAAAAEQRALGEAANDVEESEGGRNTDERERELLALEQLVDPGKRFVDIHLMRSFSTCGAMEYEAGRTLAFWTWMKTERRSVPETAERRGDLMSSS